MDASQTFVIASPQGEAIQGGLRSLWIAARPAAARNDDNRDHARSLPVSAPLLPAALPASKLATG